MKILRVLVEETHIERRFIANLLAETDFVIRRALGFQVWIRQLNRVAACEIDPCRHARYVEITQAPHLHESPKRRVENALVGNREREPYARTELIVRDPLRTICRIRDDRYAGIGVDRNVLQVPVLRRGRIKKIVAQAKVDDKIVELKLVLEVAAEKDGVPRSLVAEVHRFPRLISERSAVKFVAVDVIPIRTKAGIIVHRPV